MTATTINFGDLHNYATGEYIRPATKAELEKSLSDANGVFRSDGISVYVEGETEEARRECGCGQAE